MRKFLLILLIFSLIYLISCVFSDDHPNLPKWSWTPTINPEHTLLGIPVDSDSSDDYLIQRYSYTISYNFERNAANWVCWNLNSNWLGDVSRYSGDFNFDDAIPPEFIRVNHDDYKYTGWDRGHIVPSNDRTLTSSMNYETFYMTNVYPQRPDMNQGVWAKFEIYCNNIAEFEGKNLFIVSGGIFSSHVKLNNIIEIPDTCYKLVVILENGQELSSIDSTTEVIAIKIPNIDGIRNANWQDFKCSVDQIEQSTGYDFLNLIPDSLESYMESYVF